MSVELVTLSGLHLQTGGSSWRIMLQEKESYYKSVLPTTWVVVVSGSVT